MSKESKYSNYPNLVFREVFSSEQETRNNGGVPTDVTISKGIGSFNGTSSGIVYPKNFNGTYSIRIRFKEPTSFTSAQYLCDFRQGTGVGYVYCSGTIIVSPSGTKYANGVASNSSIAVKEIVVSGISITSTELTMGKRTAPFASYFDGDLELFEIYEGTLTDSEVKNLYDNDWHKELISSNLLLDYDSTNGYITDRTGKNTLTATDVSIKKTGGFYSSEFNGSTSKIDTGSDFIGTKAVTICGWIKAYSYGKANYGRIVDNGRLFFLVDSGLKSLRFSSNAASEVTSAANSILLRKWYFVVVTRNASGLATFYIGNKTSAPVVSGENLNSGAPISGVNNVLIGDNATGLRTFYGNITNVKVYEGILSLEELTQIWSNTRDKVS